MLGRGAKCGTKDFEMGGIGSDVDASRGSFNQEIRCRRTSKNLAEQRGKFTGERGGGGPENSEKIGNISAVPPERLGGVKKTC